MLRPAAVYRNRSAGASVDKLGKFLIDLGLAFDAAYTASGTGTGWRRHGAGDGKAASTTTLGTNIWTGNAGAGHSTSGLAWDSGAANTVSNPLAWERWVEYVDGVATGRQFQWQRSSQTTSGGERQLNVAFSASGFSGTPSATSPYTGGTHQFWFGSTAWNSTGQNWLGNISSGGFISDTATFTWTIWVDDQGDTEGCCQFGFKLSSSSGADLGFVGGYFALYETAAADAHPFVCGAGLWSDFAGADGVYTANATIIGGSSTRLHGVSSSGAWSLAGIMQYRDVATVSRPPADGINVAQVDMDGNYQLMPAYVTLDPSLVPKGVIRDLVLPFSALSTHLYPMTLTDSEGDAWIMLGAIVLPWEAGLVPTWTSSSSSTNWRRWNAPAEVVVPDVTPPAFSAFSPVAGAITYNQAITVDVTDVGSGVAGVAVRVVFSTPARAEWAIALDSTEAADYSAGSSVSGITDGKRVVVLRTGGWIGPFTLYVDAVDGEGNVATTATAAYTISTSPNPAAPDTTAPTLTLVSPLDQSLAKFEPLVVDVDGAPSRFVLYASWPGNNLLPIEPVYVSNHPDARTPFTVSTSTVGSALRLSILRRAGWTVRPRLHLVAGDASGNFA